MQLIDDLERRLSREESLFRAQLLREDIARLGRLRELARGAADATAYRNAALRLGWTQGDARTRELGAPLDALIEAVREYETGGVGSEREARIIEAWTELHRFRMERLVGCLATPLPRPAGED
jgi:hypothetical protein